MKGEIPYPMKRQVISLNDLHIATMKCHHRVVTTTHTPMQATQNTQQIYSAAIPRRHRIGELTEADAMKPKPAPSKRSLLLLVTHSLSLSLPQSLSLLSLSPMSLYV